MSVTVPATLSEFSDLVSEDIQDIFVKKMSKHKNTMEDYFNVEDTTSYYDKDSSVTGNERAKFMSENASVIYDAPLQGFDQSYTQVKYGDGMKISDHLWKFGIEFRKITSLTETLADAMHTQQEQSAADMLNNAWSTSFQDDDDQTISTAGGDAAAYFTASHTREDGKRTAVKPIPYNA